MWTVTDIQDVHLDVHTALELCAASFSNVASVTSAETIRLIRDAAAQGGNFDFHTDQVQCRFTSRETIRIIRDGGVQDGHLDFHTAPELCTHCFMLLSDALRPQKP